MTATRPVILAVDDDPQVRAAVRGDLQARYARDYRILVADGGTSGLEVARELHRRGEDVALFLVDERMPDLSGSEMLVQVREHHPEAKKVLLTAYADTDAAIRSINEVGLDHYLLKPWSPPEDQLYPVLDDLLDDWQANRPATFDGVRVLGDRWSAATHDVKDFLAQNRVPYRFLDVERDPDAAALLAAVPAEDRTLPVVVFPEGDSLSRPTAGELGGRIGLHGRPNEPFYDLIIVGAGPAGLAGAVYGASEGLKVVVVERHATGGQAGTSSRIENYLGFPKGVSGADLARRATTQAARLGAEILSPVEVASVEVDANRRVVHLAGGTSLAAHTLLIASGMKVRRLDAPGFDQLTGAGVYYGATLSEAAAYAGERVVVVGGANSAGQAALMLARFAREVVLVVRSDTITEGMSQYLVDQVEATENLRVELSARVEQVEGDGHLERACLRRGEGETWVEDATGLFVFIGAVPYTDFLDGVVARNPQGFVLTGPDLAPDGSRPKGWPLERDPYLLESSVPGIFAAGDVRSGAIRRVASAVGQGAHAISFVHQYLSAG